MVVFCLFRRRDWVTGRETKAGIVARRKNNVVFGLCRGTGFGLSVRVYLGKLLLFHRLISPPNGLKFSVHELQRWQ